MIVFIAPYVFFLRDCLTRRLILLRERQAVRFRAVAKRCDCDCGRGKEIFLRVYIK